MTTEGERLATLEAEIKELRGDIADRKHEEERTRKRLHDVEGILGMLVDTQKQARRQEERQYRRLEVRLQLMTIVVAIAGIIGPVIYSGVGR